MDFRMSHKRSGKIQTQADLSIIEVKSKFEAEFRRFPIKRDTITGYDQLFDLVFQIHKLYGIPFSVWYRDPLHGDLLPINNNDNCIHALQSAQPVLRLILQRSDSTHSISANGSAEAKRKSFFGNFAPVSAVAQHKSRLAISTPQDFRRVSAIIDVDILPETVRRVRLCKHNTDKPLGFYIRDGTSVRVTPDGIEKVPGIFISRLIPGGLAESTGLLSVNDEVLEVNGIEVSGKGLDQVTDMMVANSHNLIITVKPVNQLTKAQKGGAGSEGNTRRVTTSRPGNKVSAGSDVGSSLLEHSEPIPDSDEEDTVSPVGTDGVVHV